MQGIFPSVPDRIPENTEQMQSRIDDFSGQLGSMGDQLNAVEQQLGSVQQQLSSSYEELAAVVAKQDAVEKRYAAEKLKQPEELEGQISSRTTSRADFTDDDELWDQVQELSSRLNAMQEISPIRVCWSIANITEKLGTFGQGKSLRAQSFALCSCIVGMKLEFYPNGRGRAPDGTDERTLPEITPREHPALKEVRRAQRSTPERGQCSMGICCPMGVKLQYSLQIGRTHKFDTCHVDWSTVFHDIRIRWKEELEQDGSLLITLTVVRLHNRRLKIQGDTVWVQSE
jgi:regulator of replication initiation timing